MHWFVYRKWQKCGDFLYIIWFLFNAPYLCFSLVLLMNKTRFLFVPALAEHRDASEDGHCLGAECSDHGSSTGCTHLKEGAEWEHTQGWGSGVDGEEMYPRRNLWPATGQFWHRAGEGSESLTLSSASLACPCPSFPVGHPENCHPLFPGNDFPHPCTQLNHRKVSLFTQVKAVGHFWVHWFATSSFFPKDKILLRGKRQRKIRITSSDLSFTAFSLLELTTTLTPPFCPRISKCFTKATNITDSTLQWGKQEHKGEGYLSENPPRDQQQR